MAGEEYHSSSSYTACEPGGSGRKACDLMTESVTMACLSWQLVTVLSRTQQKTDEGDLRDQLISSHTSTLIIGSHWFI